MRAWRPFRFPPLVQPFAVEPGAVDTASLQAQAADGYRQGMDAGFNEGFADGQLAGHEAGYAAGLEAGRLAGIAEARAEVLAHFGDLAAPLDAAAARLARTCDEYQLALREDVVDIVGKVARQVIRCELALKPVQILDLVEETLAALPAVDGQVEVLLNAEECARIVELAPERAARWQLIADATLAHGECRVRTAASEADAGCLQRLEACLDNVREQLTGMLAEENAAAPRDAKPPRHKASDSVEDTADVA